MAIMMLFPGTKCDACARVMTAAESTQGWSQHDWTCRHATTYTCPACNDKLYAVPHEARAYPKCPACGCGEKYT